jgi:hypothetical protein
MVRLHVGARGARPTRNSARQRVIGMTRVLTYAMELTSTHTAPLRSAAGTGPP